MSDTVDGTAVEDHGTTTGGDLVARQVTGTLAVAPDADAQQLVARLDVIRTAMQTAMVETVDYGRIPGVDKPALFKPGAEKLGVLFQLDVQLDNEKTWGPGDHLTVMSKATVYHAPSGARLGFGEGLCSTREAKYAKRKAERECPTCGAAAIIKGKAEYGGGWLCWKRRDGCGAKFPDGDQRIEGQQIGEVDNPSLPDSWNTVVKMAEKRARVDAILAVTGASALFTQDTEDHSPGARPATPGPSRAASSDVTPDAALINQLRQVWKRSGVDVVDFVALLDTLTVPEEEDLHLRVESMSDGQLREAVLALEEIAREREADA